MKGEKGGLSGAPHLGFNGFFPKISGIIRLSQGSLGINPLEVIFRRGLTRRLLQWVYPNDGGGGCQPFFRPSETSSFKKVFPGNGYSNG